MPGGRYDSSKMWVAPFFDHLRARDATGGAWLRRLLLLPERGSGAAVPDGVGELQDHA